MSHLPWSLPNVVISRLLSCEQFIVIMLWFLLVFRLSAIFRSWPGFPLCLCTFNLSLSFSLSFLLWLTWLPGFLHSTPGSPDVLWLTSSSAFPLQPATCDSPHYLGLLVLQLCSAPTSHLACYPSGSSAAILLLSGRRTVICVILHMILNVYICTKYIN